MVREHDITITFTQPVLTHDRVRTPFHAQLDDNQSRTGDLSIWFDREAERKVSVVLSLGDGGSFESEGSDVHEAMNGVRKALVAMWNETYAAGRSFGAR